jgi:hypothetical protein
VLRPFAVLSLDLLAEQRIAEALARGELSNLPGEGQPLALDDDALIPEELRIAYRILKNAGFVPPEVACLRQIADLERLVDSSAEGETRRRAMARLNLLLAQLDARPGAGRCTTQREYRDRLIERFNRERA